MRKLLLPLFLLPSLAFAQGSPTFSAVTITGTPTGNQAARLNDVTSRINVALPSIPACSLAGGTGAAGSVAAITLDPTVFSCAGGALSLKPLSLAAPTTSTTASAIAATDLVYAYVGGAFRWVPQSLVGTTTAATDVAALPAISAVTAGTLLPAEDASGNGVKVSGAQIGAYSASVAVLTPSPVVVLTGNTVLDASVHANARLIIPTGASTSPTLTAVYATLGDRFETRVFNYGSGTITLGNGITSALSTVGPGQAANISAYALSGSPLVEAFVYGVGGTAAAPAAVPGQVTGLTVGTVTSTAIPLTWTAPSGTPTGYTVTYTPSGGAATSVATGSAGTSYTLASLTAGTAYSITVKASNATGAGAASAAVTGTTTAAAAAVFGTNGSVTTGGLTFRSWQGGGYHQNMGQSTSTLTHDTGYGDPVIAVNRADGSAPEDGSGGVTITNMAYTWRQDTNGTVGDASLKGSSYGSDNAPSGPDGGQIGNPNVDKLGYYWDRYSPQSPPTAGTWYQVWTATLSTGAKVTAFCGPWTIQ